jgi:hypothetical protein
MTDWVTKAINDLVFTSFGITFPDFVIMIILLISIIFSIQDYRIGFITLFMLSLCGYIWFVMMEFSLTAITLLLFVSLLLLAFSLYVTKAGTSGGIA